MMDLYREMINYLGGKVYLWILNTDELCGKIEEYLKENYDLKKKKEKR